MADVALLPITQDLLKEVLDDHGWPWFVDNQGDLGMRYGDINYYFFIRNTRPGTATLRVCGYAYPSIPLERVDEMREFILDWHRTHSFPLVSHTIDEAGNIGLSIAHSVSWYPGATKDQLYQQMLMGVGAGNEFLMAFNERLIG